MLRAKYASVPINGTMFTICEVCGMVVGDMGAHSIWHEQLAGAILFLLEETE